MAVLNKDEAGHPGHEGFARANPYDYRIQHKRLAWLLRLTTGLCLALTVGLLAMLATINHLLPLKEVRPALLRIDPADKRIYRVVPITQKVEGYELFFENIAMRFVASLLEIDPGTQRRRFDEALPMMAPAFFKKFNEEEIKSGRIQDFLDSGMERRIEIISANQERYFADSNTWHYAVRFILRDYDGEELVNQKPLIAYLNLTTRPRDVTEAEKYENPLGIRILDMTLKMPMTQRSKQEFLQ